MNHNAVFSLRLEPVHKDEEALILDQCSCLLSKQCHSVVWPEAGSCHSTVGDVGLDLGAFPLFWLLLLYLQWIPRCSRQINATWVHQQSRNQAHAENQSVLTSCPLLGGRFPLWVPAGFASRSVCFWASDLLFLLEGP